MRRLWRDTLFTRLLLLILVAVVTSHLVAWLVVTRWVLPALAVQAPLPPSPPDRGGPPARSPPLPTLGSLPPGAFGTGAAADPGRPAGAPPQLPAQALAVDYGIRILLIALAAWWGARWLANPVRRMVAASRQLAAGIADGRTPEHLDERRGTTEVQEAAQVFNRMADQLAREFRGRGLLMASISHDLRTPLTRMRIRLESLQPRPLAQRCIDDIHEMNGLIDGAISVFRADDPTDEPLQATDVLALVQSLCDDLEETGQTVVLHGHALVAMARPAALRRAIGNLVGNALQHGGSAEVTVMSLGGACVVVEDRGPGIPDDQLQRVLEPFHRLDPSRSRNTGGAGLGLHIAHTLLLAQGATLNLCKRSGGGLRAEVRLQAAPSD